MLRARCHPPWPAGRAARKIPLQASPGFPSSLSRPLQVTRYGSSRILRHFLGRKHSTRLLIKTKKQAPSPGLSRARQEDPDPLQDSSVHPRFHEKEMSSLSRPLQGKPGRSTLPTGLVSPSPLSWTRYKLPLQASPGHARKIQSPYRTCQSLPFYPEQETSSFSRLFQEAFPLPWPEWFFLI